MRADSRGQVLTTNQGIPIGDIQSSLKAGLRGPTLLEDFILREKITHFDHERIPERIVHARGSGAHGFLEAYDSLSKYTRAAPFATAGKITPVFVRVSTVAGERGSKDTARDVRGFAVCPFQAGTAGFISFPQEVFEDKVRGKPEKFAEHYAQATLFFESQTEIEKAHIVAAFRFELSKVAIPAIRERMVASLVNVSRTLAADVAAGLGMDVPKALPKVPGKAPSPEVKVSPTLSLMALPGECGIRTRQVAILVADGVDRASIAAIHAAITAEGAVGHFVGPRVGRFVADDGSTIEAGKSMENAPAVLFDALVLPDGARAIATLAGDGHTMEYLKDQFRHCKAILALGASSELLDMAGISATLKNDTGLLWSESKKARDIAPAFIKAIAAHRHVSRDSDPPRM